MWIAKFKLKNKGDIFTELTHKYQINFHAYPLTHYEKNKNIYFVVNGFLEGEDKNKQRFIKQLKKDKRVVTVDEKKDTLTVLITYPKDEISQTDMEVFYDPAIIHVEPVLNAKDGWEYWTAASFEKENLMQLIESAQTLHKGKLLSIENKSTDELSIISMKPHISKMQQKVILAAFSEGYYSYPRKVEIATIAKNLSISYSTTQEHLRKAEIALLPSMIRKL